MGSRWNDSRMFRNQSDSDNISYSSAGMNRSAQEGGRAKEQEHRKQLEEEEIFDSGILSSEITSFSSSEQFISTEDEISDKSSPAMTAYSGRLDQQPSSDEKTQKKQQRKASHHMSTTSSTLDSGIDIGSSDFQLSSSSVLEDSEDADSSRSYSYSKSSLRQSFESSTHTSQESEEESLREPFPWQLYFVQDDEDGNTQLHIAILQGYSEAVATLLKHIPDSRYLDIRNDYCQTALHLSVLTNQLYIVQQLIQCGANTSIVDRFGNTALHLACKMNNAECVKFLLEFSHEQKHSSLQYVPKIHHPRAYINVYNYDGVACTHIAARCKNARMLHNLLLCGADVNLKEYKGGYTLLHEAVAEGNEWLVQYLLQHPNLNLELKTYSRYTAYQLSSDYPRISKMLLDKGAARLPFYDDDDESTEDEEENEISEVTDLFHSLKAASSARTVVTTC